MASYNADIHIGVTGKAKLNQLEAQLKRTQVQLNKLNKSLQLRTRVQAIRLDTRAANTAIKQLEQRINKLGRTINVNLRVNEREGQKRQSRNTSVVVSGNENKALAGGIAAAAAQQRILNSEASKFEDQIQKTNKIEQEILSKNKELEDVYRRQDQVRKGFAEKGKSLKQSEAQLASSARIREAAQKRRIAAFEQELRLLQQQSAEQRKLQRIEDQRTKGLSFDQRLSNRRQENKVLKGAVKGGAAAGLLGLSGVPGLQGAASGALIGGGVGGPAGAIVGALVGALTDATGAALQYGNAAAIAAAEQAKFNQALRGVTSGTDYQTALESINELSEQFIQDVGTTTEQFTKLTAATTANGISVEDTAEVYRGLAAANLALGGNAERLQGILLATGQVFSKGKVQAEELRGQIGERLPGAFALFAKAVGKTPAELDKALERGEVTVEDFVKFTKSLFERFGENAKEIADAPENAGARLEKALNDLQRNVGTLLTTVGAAFQKEFTAIVNIINDATEALARFLGLGTKGAIEKTQRELNAAFEKQRKFIAIERRNQKIGLPFDNTYLKSAADEIDRLQAKLSKLKGGTAPPLTKPVSTQDPSDSTGGSKSGPRDTTAELRAAIALEKELLAIEKQRNGLSGLLGDLREQELQRQTVLAELEERRKIIQTQNITAESKKLANTLAELQAKRDLQSIENATAGIIEEATRSSIEGARELIQATNLVAANEARRKELLEQGINPALADALIEVENQYAEKRKILDADILLLENALLRVDAESEVAKKLQEQLDKLQKIKGELDESEGKAKDNAKKQNPGKIEAYMNQLQEELGDTDGMIVSLAQTIEGEIGRAMSSAVTGLIDGTTKVEDALANMFEAIGKAFVSMATEIIAKQLVMIALQSILKALGAATSGSSSSGPDVNGIEAYSGIGSDSFVDPGFIDGFSSPSAPGLPNYGVMPMASGGFVTSPTRAIVGEGGDNEYVIPSDKMSSALQRYNSGARGEAVVDGANSIGGSTAVMEADGPPTINIEGGVMNFNDESYIKQDQIPAIVSQASKQGEARALRRLQMSPTTRRKVGVR